MIPPFEITPQMLHEISQIERLIGRIESISAPKPQPHLRKSNRVRTVQGSLSIEGNTLALDQVTALLEGKTVIGKSSKIKEVLNAIDVYDKLSDFEPYSTRALLSAHNQMMSDLIPTAGKWRSGPVGILKGTAVSHIAPPADRVPHLVKDLLQFIQTSEQHPLITSCIFHYELEFIHPFEDGNGRMGRFWHTRLLYHYHPIFEFIPVESLIQAHQQEYYDVLETSDNAGHSNAFVEFALRMIRQSMADFLDALRPLPQTAVTRLEQAKAQYSDHAFARKNYVQLHKTISTATASRDLQQGVADGILEKSGEKAQTVYRFLP